MDSKNKMQAVLERLGIQAENSGTSTGSEWVTSTGDYFSSISPVDGEAIAAVQATDAAAYARVMERATAAFKEWRTVPAPQRGEVVRQIGDALRAHKEDLGTLVSYEMGKSYQEGLGEVQEMIDICDFAVGLSRQLYGLTMHSERPAHRMYEQYHPLGVVGIISAFNFPVAVWSWNTMLAWVCGDVCVWKPSEKAPLSALACQHIVAPIFARNGYPEGISCLIQGDYRVGEWLSQDKRIPLVSATGSTRMGKIVAATVAERLGRSLLELGGNNAIIISPEADMEIAIRGALFGAVGTAGQRCTTTRRLIVHSSVYEQVKERLVAAYGKLNIGNPLDEKHHVGPLIDKEAVSAYLKTIDAVQQEGGRVLIPARVLEGPGFESGCYVQPTIVEAENHYQKVQEETFAPILYLLRYETLEEAIEMQNAVPQGLSSAIMTLNMREAEQFLSAAGSDCGIANVNIGTSGAEIGGAFGGEKETGGGRESGSDAWKVYMRRQTNTINYSTALPLAQGIKFDI
ncbi:aldehyde dehydrogenase [Nitritalea halalkaliphila LW7]|uniref:aldehyde dehydrogenase (NAD(+)) n=1 Tax=Nitritalea halalkaliphila LW7 TaxID=1189621 RepID=I5C4B3_9BACT|nr:aldehyde dehydrogenase family protein [Nitritalea halalkaliphila]EIM76665.1 aldehyde dehydrogenase [Nitritalea halalkaliphila LW7]